MKSLHPTLLLSLTLALNLACTPASRAEEAGTGAMTSLLRSISVKDLKYEGAPLSKVLADLQELAKAGLSPDKTSTINLSFKVPGNATAAAALKVDLNLKNTSLYEALTVLGMLNGLDVQITAKGALLSRSDDLSLDSW